MEKQAYAKLNLSLDILRRREDGFHDLQMVMVSIDLTDTLTLTPGEGSMSTNLSFLPADGSNLAQRAATAFRSATGQGEVLDIHIDKHIPVCAGMAGGSSDAAAVLRAMNEMYHTNLSPLELADIGATVGSDVPYCVVGGTALVEGRGERVTPISPLPPCYIVVCKPPFPISTPQLFGRVNVKKITCRPDTQGLVKALEAGDLQGVARRLYNVFEDVLEPRHRQTVDEIKSTLIEYGALGAVMSGSGPTVFGLYQDEGTARKAAQVLGEQYKDVFVCQPV